MSHPPIRVAVQMFGNLRTFEQCAPALRANLLDRYDCDVFLHTWDKLDHNLPTWYNESSKSNPLDVDDGICGRIKALYHPVAFKVETQNFIHDSGKLGPQKLSLQGIKYMFYGQHAANTMRLAHEAKTKTVYDYVITLRPDLLLLRPLVLEDYANEFAFQPKASIHLVHKEISWIEQERFITNPLMLDCMFIAKPDVMTVMTNFFKHADRYLHEMPHLLPHVMINPEIGFREYLWESGVFPRQYRFYYAIKRKQELDDIIIYPPEILTPSFKRYLYLKKKKRSLFLLFRKIILWNIAISCFLIPNFIQKPLIRYFNAKLKNKGKIRKNSYLEKIIKHLDRKSF
jgi:hypothetical protein